MLIDSIAVMRIYVQDKTYLACWCSLTHWGRVTHICVGRLAIIGSDNGLSPEWRQAIMWTNAGILLFVPLGTNFGEKFNRNSNIFIEENTFENVVCEMFISSRPRCKPFSAGPVCIQTLPLSSLCQQVTQHLTISRHAVNWKISNVLFRRP